MQYLIQQSSIYVSLLSAKMKQQQEQMRQNKEKRERRALDNRAVPNNTNNNGSNNNSNSNNNGSNNSNNNNKGDDSATRRSTRGAVASSANASRPAKVTKKRRAKAAKKTATTISDYFKKAELEALPAAAEVEEEPFDENSKLGEHKNLRSARQPSLITGGVMKDYQLEGLEWLVSLYENGLNGILADEMGLGKTLQTISFLAFLREKSVWGPFLVVGPVSVLSSWVDEIARWAPDMPALLYHGTPAERAELRRTAMAKLGPGFPIICTNYEMIMNDKQFLAKYSWKFVIIDEGHRLKNMNCKLVRELKSYTSANRLLLTGTPLQNNLAELWSLLNFLLPEIFDDYQYFEEYFDFSKIQGNDKASHVAFLAKEEQKNLVGSLHALLKPFLLRRVKTDVETSLPPKKEYILYAPLSQNQKDLYGALLDHEASEWLHEQVRLRYPSSPDRSGGSLPKKRKLLAEHNDDDDGNVVTSKKPRTPEPDSESARSRRIERKEVDSYRELSDDEYFGKLEEEELMDLDPAAAAAKELSDYEKSIMQGCKSPTAIFLLGAHIYLVKQISNKKLQNLYMQLRQACNSPQMFYWPWAEEKGERPDETIITDSGKMMLLERLVPALIERGHKILIFSQFKKMLDIIEDWAEHLHGWEVCRLDGGVSQEVRREQIRKFNNEQEARIFLLTTRAGGLGINVCLSLPPLVLPLTTSLFPAHFFGHCDYL